MSVVEHELLGHFGHVPASVRGPVTAVRRRRNVVVHAVIVVLALLPQGLGMAPAWQAAGLGLFLPGGGFLAWGGWGVALLALTLLLFWLACVAWFWAGNLVAPLAVWLGAAALAGAGAETVWPPARFLVPAAAAAVWLALRTRAARRDAADRARFATRQGFYAESRAEVGQAAADEMPCAQLEMTPGQLGALRYVFERALQPVGEDAG